MLDCLQDGNGGKFREQTVMHCEHKKTKLSKKKYYKQLENGKSGCVNVVIYYILTYACYITKT